MRDSARFIERLRSALANGAERKGLTRIIWKAHGSCVDPKWTEECGIPPPTLLYDAPRGGAVREFRWRPGDQHPLILDVSHRCRKCGPCLKARAWHWSARIRAELRDSTARSWFGTLTVDPEYRYLAKCRAAARAPGGNFENASVEFLAIQKEIGKEVTKFLKRVRKGNKDYPGPHRFRYCLVTEAHKDGFPHFHIILHELGDQRISWRQLQPEWHFGFSKWNLIRDEVGASLYATKVRRYLSKSMLARVRASIDYGTVNGLNPKLSEGQA